MEDYSLAPDLDVLRLRPNQMRWPEKQKAENEYYMKKQRLFMGSNYCVNGGVVTEVMVWALGGIWYFTHTVRGEDNYQRELERAANSEQTFYIKKETP